MAVQKVEAQHLALAAAEGVAIALAARREANLNERLHIIAGIPAELFRVTIETGKGGRFNVGSVERHEG